MLQYWTAAHGQLKLSWTANESSQEAVTFLYQLGTDGGSQTLSSLWLPLCFWEIKMDNVISNCVPTVLWERDLQKRHWASLFFESCRTAFSVLCKHSAQNHCLQYPIALLFTYCIFVSPITNLKLLFFHKLWQFLHVILVYFQSNRLIFCLERCKVSFSTFS